MMKLKKHHRSTPVYRASGYAWRLPQLSGAEKLVFLVCLVLAVLCLITVFLTRNNSRWIEQYYSLGFYPLWAGAVSAVTGLLPFSLAEWVLLAFGLSCLGMIAIFVWQLVRYVRDRGQVVARFLQRALALLCVVFVLFTTNGGLNYYRYSFAQYSGLTVRPTQVAELTALCNELAQQVNILRAGLPENKTGGTAYTISSRQLATQANEAYRALTAANPTLQPVLKLAERTPPKPVFFSEIMSYMEIVGVFFPFTIEANVNVHTTAFGIPNAMCHELAHVAGFMREDEANFIAYLACRSSGEQFFRYSGMMLALLHSTNALYGQDTAAYSQVMTTLSPAVQQDFAESNAYNNRYHTWFGTFSNSVNDTYLRVNNQTDGVASYGRMVDLLLADYRNRNGI